MRKRPTLGRGDRPKRVVKGARGLTQQQEKGGGLLRRWHWPGDRAFGRSDLGAHTLYRKKHARKKIVWRSERSLCVPTLSRKRDRDINLLVQETTSKEAREKISAQTTLYPP